ncbi:hypothetical protein DSM104443_03951 [Usitatibacter rugosus]|uniref:Uncharacterized protein n=1 Tax=Usitatibacter rugosus TaxID=2732067 RepID=A0A6M4H4K2_9PROT|nr:hypothetical protein [Usitatibacter rugosus]QJR12857.1 hypothetical protein DSM104443_03951 [Usitatibacter rugosus]
MGWLSEFFFIGSAVLPVIFFLAGEPLWAAMSSTFLCMAGAVCAIDDPEAPHRRPPPH